METESTTSRYLLTLFVCLALALPVAAVRTSLDEASLLDEAKVDERAPSESPRSFYTTGFCLKATLLVWAPIACSFGGLLVCRSIWRRIRNKPLVALLLAIPCSIDALVLLIHTCFAPLLFGRLVASIG